ncbi:MAG: Lrp/AsnC family transcriptional regulator [Anaerolineales bacterium]
MSNIDILDKNIVDLLLEDGRISYMEIARRLGITERAARYRLNKMIQNGVVRVVAVVNPPTLGYNVIADVFLEVEADCIQDVARKMAEHEWISYVAYSIGETDVSLQLYAKDTDEVYWLVTDVIGKTPGVRKTVTSIVPKVIKDVYQWQIPLAACNSTKRGIIKKAVTD